MRDDRAARRQDGHTLHARPRRRDSHLRVDGVVATRRVRDRERHRRPEAVAKWTHEWEKVVREVGHPRRVHGVR